MPQVLLPGQPIQPQASGLCESTGTFHRGSYKLSSIVGRQENSRVVSSRNTQTRNRIPRPGDVILGRVTRVTQKQANVSILVINDQPCTSGDWHSCGLGNAAAGEDPTGSDFYGIIRIQDVRATEKDKVNMFDSFRAGDLIRAQVISLGDQRAYFLATHSSTRMSEHLGVIHALAEMPANALLPRQEAPAGVALVAVNWQEMRNPQTGQVEKRKVAKPMTTR